MDSKKDDKTIDNGCSSKEQSSKDQIYSGAIGIELGSSKAVFACFNTRGVDVILSDTGDKSTKTIVAYTK